MPTVFLSVLRNLSYEVEILIHNPSLFLSFITQGTAFLLLDSNLPEVASGY